MIEKSSFLNEKRQIKNIEKLKFLINLNKNISQNWSIYKNYDCMYVAWKYFLQISS